MRRMWCILSELLCYALCRHCVGWHGQLVWTVMMMGVMIAIAMVPY